MSTQRLKELAKLADSEVTWILLPKDLANEGWCTEVVNYISVVSPSTITALVDRIEAAERERDELEEYLIAAINMQSIHMEACQKAEAELARRDAAAGEPVGFIRPGDIDALKSGNIATVVPNNSFCEVALYTAAPPAMLPPKKVINASTCGGQLCRYQGYNEALRDVRALGAQPQRVVELPYIRQASVVKGHGFKTYPLSFFHPDEVKAALDAANVPYTVAL